MPSLALPSLVLPSLILLSLGASPPGPPTSSGVREAVPAAHEPRHASVALATGVRLHYVEQGDPAGEPLLLLHGITDSWFSFSRILPLLPKGYRVIVPDQRGHGDSERPAGGYEPTSLADDAVALMDALGVRRATIVGHSMGSIVAQEVARRAPDRVAGLVLVGSDVAVAGEVIDAFLAEVDTLRDPIPDAYIRGFQESTVHRPVPAEFMDSVVAASRKAPARVWRAALHGLVEASYPIRPGRAGVPVLLVWGERDNMFGRKGQEALLALHPGSRLIAYPDAGHTPHWEWPERFTRDVTAWLVRGAASAR